MPFEGGQSHFKSGSQKRTGASQTKSSHHLKCHHYVKPDRPGEFVHLCSVKIFDDDFLIGCEALVTVTSNDKGESLFTIFPSL